MNQKELEILFNTTCDHKVQHACGGHPYEYGSVLTTLVAATHAKTVLEVGTALGYTAACLAVGSTDALVDTIDQDQTHLNQAMKNWLDLGLEKRITPLYGKAEAVLPTLQTTYDFIFFDAYAPQIFMLNHFERLLKVGGVLVTANLYLKDPTGGKYVRRLKNEERKGNVPAPSRPGMPSSNVIEMLASNTVRWTTGFFGDTAISVKH